MMSKDTAMLFDFDGTLMDTEAAIVESFRELFRRYHHESEFTKQNEVEVLGPSLTDLMTRFFPDGDIEALQQEYRVYQNEHLSETVKYMPGCLELVSWLKDNDYKVGIVSTRRHESLDRILNLMNLSNTFDIVIGDDDVSVGKPNPEGILKACRELNCSKSMYVGDSITDVQAGKAAGSTTVAFVSNIHKKEALLKELPDYLTDDLGEIITIVKGK